MTDDIHNRPAVRPIRVDPSSRIQPLSPAVLAEIHHATTVVLEKSGVIFPCKAALEIFAAAGASVDFASSRVKISPDLLASALAHVPRDITLGARGAADLDLKLDGKFTYVGTGGTGVSTLDRDSGRIRPSTKRDTQLMALVADYLPSVAFYWPMAAPRDYPSEILPLHELDASFKGTEKHVVTASCVSRTTAAYAVEMAAAVAGSTTRLRLRPPISLIVSPISPLRHDEGTLEAALVFAESGLPVGFATMPILGSTAPASVTGTLIQGNAELLSGIAMVQLAFPGTPVTYPLFTGIMDPHTGNCLVSNRLKTFFYAAAVQLGHFYHLPVQSSFGGTNLERTDCWQTGKEDALDAFFMCAAGPEMIPCLGMLGAYTLLAPEKILLDDEIVETVRYMLEGMQIDPVAAALDEILAVGAGGHYLSRSYTLEKMRDFWDPGVSFQWSGDKGRFQNAVAAAGEKFRWIVEHHHTRPPASDVEAALRGIIRSAQKELLNS